MGRLHDCLRVLQEARERAIKQKINHSRNPTLNYSSYQIASNNKNEQISYPATKTLNEYWNRFFLIVFRRSWGIFSSLCL